MGYDYRTKSPIWHDDSNENIMQLELKIPSNNYTSLLIEELFKYLDYNILDLSNHESIKKMGKVFSMIKTKKCRDVVFDIMSKLDEEQFGIVYGQMKNSS